MTEPFLNQTGTTAAETTTKTTPSWLSTTLDSIKYGVGIWSDAQKLQAEKDTAAAAIRLKTLELQALEQEKLIKQSDNTTKSSTIKSYGVPILITGVVVALGIGTYFYFKKKNVN